MTKEIVLTTLRNLNADARVWVAGSAAIVPDLAGDLDIWVEATSTLKYESFNLDLWEEKPQLYKSLPVDHKLQVTFNNLKIQVMFLEKGVSIFDLLGKFDVSCHQFARNVNGVFIAGSQATFPGTPIHQLQPDYEPAPFLDDEPLGGYCADDSGCMVCKGHKTSLVAKKLYETLVPPMTSSQRVKKFTERYESVGNISLWILNA